MKKLHIIHVHDDAGDHADGETYSIVYACDEHRVLFENVPEAEYIAEFDADAGDFCDHADCVKRELV